MISTITGALRRLTDWASRMPDAGLTNDDPRYGWWIEGAKAREDARVALQESSSNEASPDDLRDAGWAVAVHNDYRLNGQAHTFWLFTKDGRAVKGEGLTDAEALNAVRAAIE
jgi:hypothetical protein